MGRELLVRPWTQGELQCLRGLWFTNCTVLQIAHRLRRTVSAVNGKAKLLGLPCKTRAQALGLPIPPDAVRGTRPSFD